jgi:hypothetical protein
MWINEAELSDACLTKSVFEDDHSCEGLLERHERLLSAKGSQREAHIGGVSDS